MEDERIIQELRRVAAKLGKDSLSMEDYFAHGKISMRAVQDRFGRWNAAVEAAGLKTYRAEVGLPRGRSRIPEKELLKELIRLTEEFGRRPGERLINRHGLFSAGPYRDRWDTIEEACDAAYATYGYPLIDDEMEAPAPPSSLPRPKPAKPKAVDVQARIPEPERPPRRVRIGELLPKPVGPKAVEVHARIPEPEPPPRKTRVGELRPKPAKPKAVGVQARIPEPEPPPRKAQVGELIDFRGLRFAPVNALGVAYLFGMISRELGFIVESVGIGYPQCDGKRRIEPEGLIWEYLLMQFEYRSTDFRANAFSAEECDLIVCWIHDWEDCPIEVLELKSRLGYLPDR